MQPANAGAEVNLSGHFVIDGGLFTHSPYLQHSF